MARALLPLSLLILIAYVALALGYGALNPIFEAPDEDRHYFNAQQLSQTRELPRIRENQLARQEAAQPPLYYALSALVIAALRTEDPENLVWPNPSSRIAVPDAFVDANRYVHIDPLEARPWHGYALAVHVLRGISTLLGGLTLVSIFGIGRGLWPDRPERALVAMALVAFLPQFAFLHASVSNDPLVIALCSLALWQMLALESSGASSLRAAVLGATIGLAILSKMTGLLLFAPATLAIVLVALRDGSWRALARDLASLLVPALVLSGPVLWRNWTLYGDPTAANQFVAIAGGDRGWTLVQVLRDLPRVAPSFVAVFGWMNVYAPAWIHACWLAIASVGGLGALVGLLRRAGEHDARPRSRTTGLAGGAGAGAEASASSSLARLVARTRAWAPSTLLAVWLAAVLASWLRFQTVTWGDQGRLAFPAIAPMGLFLAYGLLSFGRTGREASGRVAAAIAVTVALVTSLACVGRVIPAAYAPPSPLREVEIPDSATPFDASMGEGLELLALEMDRERASPGDVVWVTSWWRSTVDPPRDPHLRRAHRSPPNAPRMVVEVAVDGRIETRLIGYHGGGLLPATLWPRGSIVIDRRPIFLDRRLPAPASARVEVRLTSGVESIEVGRISLEPAGPGGSRP